MGRWFSVVCADILGEYSKQQRDDKSGHDDAWNEGEYWADHKDRNTHFATEEEGFDEYNPNFYKQYDSFDFPG